MLTHRQRHAELLLSVAQMDMLPIARNRLPCGDAGRVYHQMEVAGPFLCNASRFDDEVLRIHAESDGPCDSCAVGRRCKEDAWLSTASRHRDRNGVGQRQRLMESIARL